MLLLAMAMTTAAGPQYRQSLNGGPEVMWELPNSTPHSALFLAHGCNHQGTDFWSASSACPRCLGLPEEVRITKAALAAGFAVVAITSADRSSGCWDFEVDGPVVKESIAVWKAVADLPASLPLVAFGASSGGAFVLQLPTLLKCAAIISQIMAIPPQMLPPDAPPTLFVHMPRDVRTAGYVHKCVRRLGGQGVAAHALEVPPQKPTADFFLARIERLAPETAHALHAALRRAGLLDADGYLANDPRRTPWRDALASAALRAALPGPAAGGAPDSLVGDQSAVAEALNVAWAAHEIASDPMATTLAWLANVRAGKPERAPNATPAVVENAASHPGEL